TEKAHFDANTGEDTFNSPSDVDYYRLSLPNAGPTGSVTVSQGPTSPDVHPFATLFRRDSDQSPWQPIDSGQQQNGPLVLALAPPAGEDLTDGQYLLALAPQGFDTAAQAYALDIDASPGLAPPTLSAAQLGAAAVLLTPPVSSGVAQVQHA